MQIKVIEFVGRFDENTYRCQLENGDIVLVDFDFLSTTLPGPLAGTIVEVGELQPSTYRAEFIRVVSESK